MFNKSIMNFIQYIHEDKKEWARKLTEHDIADILNSFALLKPYNTNVKDNIIVMRNSEIAAIAGIQGEQAFEKLVRQNLSGDFEINNMSKTSKSGDFIIVWTSYKTNKKYTMLVDVKNYNSTVPSREVLKFHRDVGIKDVDCGMLLSLSSKIVSFSHTIESKYIIVGNKKVPLVFMQSNIPSAITEMIKTTFHIIETSELHNNKIQYMDEFISSVAELHENINIVSRCRDAMAVSKHEIEKSLNGVMMQLMTCEYELIANIKKIQAAMVNYNAIEDIEDKSSIEDTLSTQSELSETEKLVKHVISAFNISKTTEILVSQIFKSICDFGKLEELEYKINLSKKIVCITNIKIPVTIKFMKTVNYIIINSATKIMMSTICELTKEKNCRTTNTGYVIKINDNTINAIIKLLSVGCDSTE